MILYKSRLGSCRIVLLGAALLLAPVAAAAQQTPNPQLPLPPVETGKPMVFDLPDRVLAPEPPAPGCTDPLPCRLRVVGAVRRGGAVELKATAFSW